LQLTSKKNSADCGWWLVLVCCERKLLLAGWWLVLVWWEKNTISWLEKQPAERSWPELHVWC